MIREADGTERVYHADAAEGHINGFPIGSRLTKRRWHLDYELDGRTRNDFPLPLYAFWMILDLGLLLSCVILAIMINLRDRRARELEALGFLQMVLAVRDQVAWTGGFAVVS